MKNFFRIFCVAIVFITISLSTLFAQIPLNLEVLGASHLAGKTGICVKPFDLNDSSTMPSSPMGCPLGADYKLNVRGNTLVDGLMQTRDIRADWLDVWGDAKIMGKAGIGIEPFNSNDLTTMPNPPMLCPLDADYKLNVRGNALVDSLMQARDIRTDWLDVWNGVKIGDVSIIPGYKLYVEDGMITEKIKITLVGDVAWPWPDYVFEENYEQASLSEVEEFVQLNKHLPNMLSAEELKKEGLNVAEMDAALLRQIEELWLHVFEINKENKLLEEKVEQLTKKKRKRRK